MNSTILNRSGLFLIVAGIVGVGISALGIRNTFVEQGGQDPAVLAEGINGTLVPALVGALLLLVGVIMVVAVWWRGYRSKRLQSIQ